MEKIAKPDYQGSYLRLVAGKSEAEKKGALLEAIQNRDCDWIYAAKPDDFKKIPGRPVVYWATERFLSVFNNMKINDIGKTRVGLQTGDNARFVRQWYECSAEKSYYYCVSREDAQKKGVKWVPYNKGGKFRKWFGNVEAVVNWENDGQELFEYARSLYGSPTRTVKNSSYYFLPSVTWSKISSGVPSFRCQFPGAIFDVAGASVFYKNINFRNFLLGMLNSKVATGMLKAISPTLNFETTHIASLPIIKIWEKIGKESNKQCESLINESKVDWNAYETSWEFTILPLLKVDDRKSSLEFLFQYLLINWKEKNL